MTRVIRRCDTTPCCVAVDVGRAEPLAGCCLWGWFVGKSRGSCGDDLLGLGGGEFEHFTGHDLAEAIDTGDAVLHFEDGADFLDVEIGEVGGLDLTEEDVLDFAGAQGGLGGHDAGR